ncbi:MAG: hypothetical protein SGI73_03995 [Chloroflexota bacterium]|nr:hypothetical protein [Chloroflexota bacterium]
MIVGNRWVENETITDDAMEYLMGILLEKEVPLSTHDLALALIDRRLQSEQTALLDRFKNVRIYAPAHSYDAGQRLMFTTLDNRIGTVLSTRAGESQMYGAFTVIQVEFENSSDTPREFASALIGEHVLNERLQDAPDAGIVLPGMELPSAQAIFDAHRHEWIERMNDALTASDDLVSVAGKWFPRSLMLDVNEGHLNLTEAVLDLADGQPMLTSEILRDVGGVGKADTSLQEFCLNDALNRDSRFDEVGPVDTVMWYLRRLEPPEVQTTPPMLTYTPIDYDPTLLTPEMEILEREIDDEWSSIDFQSSGEIDSATILLIYPHRRVGTLPLNHAMQNIFPTARRTPRVYVTLIDGQDGEEFTGWVVRQDRYVYGLNKLYRKHSVPVGAKMLARRSDEPGKIIVNVQSNRKRTEYVRLIVPKEGQITFEEQKRSLSAEYDDQIIVGADDIAAVDALFQATSQGRKTMTTLLRTLLAELVRASPQGAVHAKTLYSAYNILRRCPPGPIFAALMTGMDFEHVGNHYWKLRD